MKRILSVAALLAVTACAGQLPPASPGEHVTFQDVDKEVQRPCPVTVPSRPAKLARPLPDDPGRLSDILAAKLLEWDGPGKYGDQADKSLKVCTAP